MILFIAAALLCCHYVTASSPLSPLLSFGTDSCSAMDSYHVISSAVPGECTLVEIDSTTLYVKHNCATTGLIQVYVSPGCADTPLVETTQPICSDVVPQTSFGVCCAPSSTSPGEDTGLSGKSWPLSQCRVTSAPTPSNSNCRPIKGTNKAKCQKKLKLCADEGRNMKWTSVGCKTKTKRFGDGGCQCDNSNTYENSYCGYGCKKACKKDKQCKWEYGQCFNKAGVTVFGGEICGPRY